jgi:alpha-methylacyl-CoA racemase
VPNMFSDNLVAAGLAPVPMVGLMLQDHGADVVRVDQFSALFPDLLGRGKKSISLNLKQPNQELQSAAHGILHKLVANSDVLLDPFRPGTLEGLGWSPQRLHEVNSQLVVARLTGYGGCAYGNTYTKAAGHDINYIAMSGMLSLMRRGSEKPQAPLNLLGDFAGGSSMAFSGMLHPCRCS